MSQSVGDSRGFRYYVSVPILLKHPGEGLLRCVVISKSWTIKELFEGQGQSTRILNVNRRLYVLVTTVKRHGGNWRIWHYNPPFSLFFERIVFNHVFKNPLGVKLATLKQCQQWIWKYLPVINLHKTCGIRANREIIDLKRTEFRSFKAERKPTAVYRIRAPHAQEIGFFAETCHEHRSGWRHYDTGGWRECIPNRVRNCLGVTFQDFLSVHPLGAIVQGFTKGRSEGVAAKNS